MSRAQQLKPGDVSLGQSYEFFKAFCKAGGTISMVQHAIEDITLMQRFVTVFPQGKVQSHAKPQQDGLACDATFLLGFGPASTEPLPQAAPGEVVIRYGGWSLQELRESSTGKELMFQDHWSDGYPWNSENLPTGIYRFRVPVPNSNCKTYIEQTQILSSGEEPAPIVLAATAMLVGRFLRIKEYLLRGHWTRCREQMNDDRRVGLIWSDDRLHITHDWNGYHSDYLWLSSVRTS